MMDIEGRESKGEGNERVGERGMERERGEERGREAFDNFFTFNLRTISSFSE
jgi:hypothetical protein